MLENRKNSCDYSTRPIIVYACILTEKCNVPRETMERRNFTTDAS